MSESNAPATTSGANTSGEGLLMSLAQLGKFLGVSYETAKDVTRVHPDFPIIKIGKRHFFLRESVKEWVNGRATTRAKIDEEKQAQAAKNKTGKGKGEK